MAGWLRLTTPGIIRVAPLQRISPRIYFELLAGVAVTGLLALLLFVFARAAARPEAAVPG